MILQLLLAIVGAVPLLISSSLWISYAAGFTSVVISKRYIYPMIIARSDTRGDRLMWMLSTFLLWLLPFYFAYAYLAFPDRGWRAVVRLWPAPTVVVSVIMTLALMSLAAPDRRKTTD